MYLFDEEDFEMKLHISQPRQDNYAYLYRIFASDIKQVRRMYKYLYKDAHIYLDRKYEKMAASGQFTWRPDVISMELSGNPVKIPYEGIRKPEPKADGDISQGQSVEDDTCTDDTRV